MHYTDDLMQDCGNPSGLAIELLKSCTEPSILCLISLFRISRDHDFYGDCVVFDPQSIKRYDFCLVTGNDYVNKDYTRW